MKNKTIILLIIVGLVWTTLVLIVGVVLSRNQSSPEYEYIGTGYFYGSILKIDGIDYIEVDETIFLEIEEQLLKLRHELDFSKFIIGIEYPYVNEIWKYNIYGSKEIEERILLIGEEAYTFNDANYPEIYFCRKDIFNELKGELESLKGVNIDIFLN